MAELPKEGFLKIVKPKPLDINSSDKVALIRKANELFNSGNVKMAQKIFVSLAYSDGLIRVGDYYYNKSDFFEAYRMYKIAPAPKKAAIVIEQMAEVVKQWVSE